MSTQVIALSIAHCDVRKLCPRRHNVLFPEHQHDVREGYPDEEKNWRKVL